MTPDHEARAEWREIATAPKDGTRVLLGYKAGTLFIEAAVVCGSVDDDRHARKPAPYWSNDYGRIVGLKALRTTLPDGWQPLPEPPK